MSATGSQSVPLLMTKLFVPRIRADLVLRQRMIERLDEGLRRKLTLISAPAGFGKTTLVSSWLQPVPRDSCSFAWFSIDERDNDVERFLTYLVEALHMAEPAIGNAARQMIESGLNTQPELVIVQLINDAGALSGQLVLVLDDYHLIETSEIHELMDFFIDNLPDQLHVIITCRADPPLSLSRWRGRREMVEIRAEDLRFNIEETENFLQNVLGEPVGVDDVQELERRTEGWITGLQLAAISLRDREDVHAFIHSFSGQHRHIFDYLIDEVLEREAPATQEFLLQTSLFGQFTAELCDAVTGRTDSQVVLEYLERSNLFIAALDSQRRWFRYHHLFADLLRQKLRQAMPGIIPELRRRASLWFEQHGDPVEAIWQAISGEDWPRVDALIKEHERSLINQGLSRVVLRMYQSIPDDVVRSSPWLLFSRATAYDLNGEVEGSARDLALLEQLVERLEQSPEEPDRISEEDRLRLRTSLARTLAFTAVLHNDFESMLRRSDDALQYLPPDEHEIRGLTRGIRAQPQWLVGDLEGAAADFRQAIELSKLADAPIAHLIGLLGLGSIEVEWGQFDRAADHYSQAISFAERHGLATWQYTGRIMSFQSEVPYERNEFEEALAIATRAREIVAIWASRHAFDISYLHLARIHHALGDLERARSLLRQSPPYGGVGPGYVVVAQIEAYQALVDLEAGERGQLAAIEKELTMPVSEVLDRIWLWTPALRTRAQVLNAIGRFDEAVELLDPLFEICIERGWTRQAVQTGAVLALSYQGRGNQRAALRVFEQALAEAEPRGFLRSILDAGAGITQVMDAVRTRRRDEGRDTAYVDRLLVAARAEVLAQADKPVARDLGLVDPLSEREIEVLQLIAAGHTNAEIADKLYVVVGTVKAHTHNIYSKLGVRSRTQAVMRGRELRLLD